MSFSRPTWTSIFRSRIMLLLLHVRLPVSDHVVAVAETLLAQIANERSVAVLKRRAGTGRCHATRKNASAPHRNCGTSDRSDSPRHNGDASPASRPHLLLLRDDHSLLLFSHSPKLFVPLLFLVLVRLCDGVGALQMVVKLRPVPEGLQTHPARQTVVLFFKELKSRHDLLLLLSHRRSSGSASSG